MIPQVESATTIANFIEPLNEFINKKLGTTYKVNDYTSSNFPSIWTHGELTIDETQALISEFIFSDNSLGLIPIDGAFTVLKEIKDLGGVQLHIVSARDTLLLDATLKWLDKHFSEIFATINLCNHYGQGIKRSKVDVCNSLGIKIVIDDNILNYDETFSITSDVENVAVAKAIEQNITDNEIIVHKQPWNDGLNWNDIKYKLHELYKVHITNLGNNLLKNPILIAISGKIGSGKDTVANIIHELFPIFGTAAFADRVKKTVAALTNTSIEMNYDRKYKSYIPSGFTDTLGRLHQKIGAGLKDILGPNIWADCLLSTVQGNTIITDCRHLCEVQGCISKNALLIRINGDPADIRKINADGRDLNHISETELDSFPFKYVIENDGNIDDLRRNIINILFPNIK